MRFFLSPIDIAYGVLPRLFQIHYQAFLRRHMARIRSRMRETLAAIAALEWLLTAVNAQVFLREMQKIAFKLKIFFLFFLSLSRFI